MRRRTPSTLLSRLAALTTGALGAAAAAALGGADGPGYAVVLALASLVAGGVAAVKMWCDNCFESRLVAVTVATVALLGQLLTGVVGGPVTGVPHWGAVPGLVLVTALGVLATLAADTVRRLRSGPEGLPYAL